MRLLRSLAALLVAVPSLAGAHIVFAEPTAAAGSYYVGLLRVSHGCGDSPTVSVRVEIPSGIDVARPQPKPGWTLAIEHVPLGTPIRSESGGLITQRVAAITWTGTLPADQFDQFGVMLKLPNAGQVYYFPTTQRCAIGVNAWVNTPPRPEAWHATKMPAPMLTVTGGKGMDAMEHMDMPHH